MSMLFTLKKNPDIVPTIFQLPNYRDVKVINKKVSIYDLVSTDLYTKEIFNTTAISQNYWFNESNWYDISIKRTREPDYIFIYYSGIWFSYNNFSIIFMPVHVNGVLKIIVEKEFIERNPNHFKNLIKNLPKYNLTKNDLIIGERSMIQEHFQTLFLTKAIHYTKEFKTTTLEKFINYAKENSFD